MYESFYELDRAPFTNIPDPDFLFLSPEHQRAISVLRYALMARAGFCVITGDVGAGKTTLLRSVLQSLDEEIEVGLVSNTQCDSFEEFLRWILLAFDLEYRGKDKVELYDTFVSYLISQYDRGHAVALVIDEAQNLGMEYLEQLRMLSNINTEKGQILQTILVGQPELWDLLRQPALRQFAQRISYDYFLKPLETAALTGEYITHRLQSAGGTGDTFDPAVVPLIWQATGGVPRLINLICDTALVYGYAESAPVIGTTIIEQVIRDKELSLARDPGPDARTPLREEAARQEAARSARRRGASGPSTIERAALRMGKDS